MKRRLSILFIFFFLLKATLVSLAQEADLQVTDSTGHLLYIINNGVVIDAVNKKPLLNIKGNMIYKDSSEAMKDVQLLVRSEDIFSKSIDHAYKSDMHTVVFSISRGKFFLEDANVNNPTATIGYYKVDAKGNLGLYTGLNNQLIARVNGNDMTAGELTTIFYLLMNKLGLDIITQANIKVQAPASTSVVDVSETRGTIRRVWNTGADEFIWDGFSIKRKFNSLDNEEWGFDGRTLKRVWPTAPGEGGSGGNDGYSWDGKELRRKFNTGTDDFEWDGKVIRRTWNTGADEFSIDGNSVKRIWDATGNDEWETTGDVPIPIIAMVVFGLLSK